MISLEVKLSSNKKIMYTIRNSVDEFLCDSV